MNDFLITTEEGEHHRLLIAKTEGTTNPLIYIHTNHRTIGLSPSMAEEIMKGLMAILKGGFSRAISETALRMEQEEAARYSRYKLTAEPSPSRRESAAPTPTPTLENL